MLVLALLLALGASPDPGPQGAAERAREIVESGSYQRYLPGQEPANSSGGGGHLENWQRGGGGGNLPAERDPTERDPAGASWERGRPGAQPRSNEDGIELPALGAAGPVLQALGWVAIGLLLAWSLVWLVRARRNAPPARAAPLGDDTEAGDSPSASAEPDGTPLGSADALARDGRFAEAIHRLLLDSLEWLQEQGALTLTPSNTTREAIAQDRLEARDRDALHALAREVEVSLFGGRAADEHTWARCKEQRSILTGPEPGVDE